VSLFRFYWVVFWHLVAWIYAWVIQEKYTKNPPTWEYVKLCPCFLNHLRAELFGSLFGRLFGSSVPLNLKLSTKPHTDMSIVGRMPDTLRDSS
jgi:hypothetical protein